VGRGSPPGILTVGRPGKDASDEEDEEDGRRRREWCRLLWDRLVPPCSDACPPDFARRGDSLSARVTSASMSDRNASNTDRISVGMRDDLPRPGKSSTLGGGGGGDTRGGILF